MTFTHMCVRMVSFAAPVTIAFIDIVGRVVGVNGVSMQDTLQHNDWVFLSTWNIFKYKFCHGEVVCLISPKDPNEMLVKRVVGLEGDIVRPHIGKNKGATVKVPKGHCWVEGDHHKRSIDSNMFGPVSVGLIKGKVTHIVWPPKHWKKLENSELDQERIMKSSEYTSKNCYNSFVDI